MSMGMPADQQHLAADEEIEEIVVEVTEDNLVWLHAPDWELFLSPEEARELGEALTGAAADAEGPTE